MRILVCFFSIAACSLLLGCTGSNDAQADASDTLSVCFEEEAEELDELDLWEEDTVPVTVDEVFDDFFFRLVSDPEFLRERSNDTIDVSPLLHVDLCAVPGDRMNDMEVAKDTSLRKVLITRFVPHDSIVKRYTFGRSDGKWRLEDDEDLKVGATPLAQFLQFFSHWSTDSAFQTAHVIFPLSLRVELEDEDGEEVDTQVSRDEWPLLTNDYPLAADTLWLMDYGQPQISQNRKVLQLRGLSNGLFFTLKFDRTGDEWRLFEIEN